MTNITNERRDTTRDPTEIKRIIKGYYAQLYVHKLDSLDEMDQFCERHDLPKLTQEETRNLNKGLFLLKKLSQ